LLRSPRRTLAAADALVADDLTDATVREAFRLARCIIKDGGEVSMLTMCAALSPPLPTDDTQAAKEKRRFIVLCFEGNGLSATPPEQVVAQLAEIGDVRRARSRAHDISADKSSDAAQIADFADRQIVSPLRKRLAAIRPVGMSHGIEKWEEREARGEPATVKVCDWGTALDQYTSGIRAGKHYVIGADPGCGKTAIAAAHLAMNAARAGGRVVICCKEMPWKDLACRLLANMSGLPHTLIADGRLSDVELIALAEYRAELKRLPIEIKTGTMKASDVVAEVSRCALAWGGVDLVVVDHAQNIDGSRPRMSETETTSEVSRTISGIGADFDCATVLLSQFRKRQDPAAHPTKYELKQSASLEEDADVIVLLHRPDRNRQETVGIVAKNRGGRCGSVQMYFDWDSMTWS